MPNPESESESNFRRISLEPVQQDKCTTFVSWVAAFSFDPPRSRFPTDAAFEDTLALCTQQVARFTACACWPHVPVPLILMLYYFRFLLLSSVLVIFSLLLLLLLLLPFKSIIMFGSGIPTVESSWDQKYGGSESYWDYKERTSILIPMPPGEFCRLSAKMLPSGRAWGAAAPGAPSSKA